jgi:ELWxxDGT repeat protein
MKATLVKEFVNESPTYLTGPSGEMMGTSYPGTYNTINDLTNINGQLYITNLSAYGMADPSYPSYSLWKSDGTEIGTTSITGGALSFYAGHSFFNDVSYLKETLELTNVNSTVYFLGQNSRTDFYSFEAQPPAIWKTSGTTESTMIAQDLFYPINQHNYGYTPFSYTQNLKNINGTLYFTAGGISSDSELYSLDQESFRHLQLRPSYVIIADDGTFINTTDPFGIPTPYTVTEFTNIDTTLYLSLSLGFGNSDYELWKTNSTLDGMELVKEINPIYGGSSNPSGFINVNNTLYFTADDGTHGKELWKTDGTEAGTVLVKDINPGLTGAKDYSYLSELTDMTNINGTLYFIANDGTRGKELWKTDGTEAGTVLVKDINPGSANGEVTGLTNVNGTLYFIANDGIHGQELWKSDGTEAGTVMVKDINPGITGSRNYTNLNNEFSATDIDGVFYFTANDGTHGAELWKSDGTEAGTVMVQDMNPDVNNYGPDNLTEVDGTLYFSTKDDKGAKVWKLGTEEIIPTATEGSDSILGTNGADTIDGLAGDDTIKSLDGNDQLFGSDGKDYLDGGKGNDSMQGGMGDDTYFVDSINDKVTENLNSGNDIVFSTVSYTIPNNVERLSLFGSQPDKIATGRGSADYLIGSAVADKLIGNAGDDTMKGNGGIDTMIGGAGNDFYLVDQTGDVIRELSTGGNNDQVYSSVNYTIPANVEKLYLVGTTAGKIATGRDGNNYLIGSSVADKLLGKGGNDTLLGGGGNDTMIGGTGNDLYIVDQTGDVIKELADGGNNDQIYSSVSYTASANVEKVYLVGTTTDRILTGRDGKDYLIGSSVADKLLGKGGADILIGGDGNDKMTGGAGNDILQGGNGADHFIYNTNKVFAASAIGIDTITDFTKSQADKILLGKKTFTKISSIAGKGFSVKSEFATLTSNFDTSKADIVYDSGTGKLFYNQNGIEAGYGTGGHFITLANKPALAGSDFIIQA